jgi:hypothetical protein
VHAHAAAPGPSPSGAPGIPETWAKPLPGKEAAIAFLNRDAQPATFTLALSEIPWLPNGADTCDVHDVWADANSTVTGGKIHYSDVRSHQAILLRLSNCRRAAASA